MMISLSLARKKAGLGLPRAGFRKPENLSGSGGAFGVGGGGGGGGGGIGPTSGLATAIFSGSLTAESATGGPLAKSNSDERVVPSTFTSLSWASSVTCTVGSTLDGSIALFPAFG